MNKYYKTLGLEEGASEEEIEAAFTRLSKDLDPASNDNLDFFIEEYALVQEAYKKLTGKEIEPEVAPKSTPSKDSLNLFDKDSSLISIIKIYNRSNNIQKTKILNELESFKSENKTYQDVLSILKKEEKQKGIDKKNDKNPEPSKKSNKIRNLSIVILLLPFLLAYALFLKKVNDIEKNIPIITKKSKLKQEESLDFWKAKLFKEYPNLTDKNKIILNDEFDQSEFNKSEIKDSLISFFIYRKTLKIPYYKDRFFECVYQNRINDKKYKNLKYLKIRQNVWKKHKLSSDKYDMLIDLVGGVNVFLKETPLEIDTECSKCIENYNKNHEINTIALSEFYSFISQYLKFEKEIEYANKWYQRDYNKVYKNQVAGMSQSLMSKLNLKLKNKPLFQNELVYGTYRGSSDGLGLVTYSLEKKTKKSKSQLQNYINEVYAEYYSTNSLRTGSTPYAYCYGNIPYCSPPEGYPECSYIEIKASSKSDVIVIVKKYNNVYSHAYIKAGGYHKFKLGNGKFQTFFYYGNGWNPKKFMKNANCGKVTGGFVNNESLDKSDMIYLRNSSMSYTLYNVDNGNFQPKSSNKNEAF